MFRKIIFLSVFIMCFNLFSVGRLLVRGCESLANAKSLAEIKMTPDEELFLDVKFIEKASGRVVPRVCLKEEAQFSCSRGEAEIHLNVGTKDGAEAFLGADPNTEEFHLGAISCVRI